MSPSIKEKLYEILEPSWEQGKLSSAVDIFLILLILANVAVILLETVAPYDTQLYTVFRFFELFSVTIFSIEYILRLWTCTVNPQYSSPFSGRLRYAVTPFALIDLFAILPAFIPFIIPVDLRFLRILRLIRLVRVFKLARYSDEMALFFRVLNRKKDLLFILVSFVAVLVVISSCFLYYAEHDVQPEKFASIPDTMWWSIATLTTVGYGDVYPVTPVGKFFAALTAIFGIGLFALPAGILASGFVEELQRARGHEVKVQDHTSSPAERIALLERADQLRSRGILDEEEFMRMKESILEEKAGK